MNTVNRQAIAEIRSFNRFYTNILGLLDRHILNSDYSLTEVRIMLEIDRLEGCTANALIDKLDVDRGYMSRILKRFESKGIIRRESSSADARKAHLHLTEQGKGLLDVLESKSDSQVQSLIGSLAAKDQEKLVEAMKYIRDTLSASLEPVKIRTFLPRDVDYIIRRHKELYDLEYGFSPVFSGYVEDGVKKFAESYKPEEENIWVAEVGGKTAGVIALVKVDDTTAQLRWFLMEPDMRGRGIGHSLMKILLDFCRAKGYRHVFLWTVSILEAARHLYKSYGFTLTETHGNDAWSRGPVTEERWDLYL